MKQGKKRTLAAALCLCLLGGAFHADALTVEQARSLLLERYVDEVPPAALEQETVEETFAALGDPYSWYMEAEELAEYLNTDVDEKIVGIGVTMTLHEDGAEVVAVEKNGPAGEGGLQAGDVLLAADGVSLKGLDLDGIGDLIRGEEGTSVRLTYRRGNRRNTVTLTRREVVIPATRGTLWDSGIGYIDCDSFGTDTAGHFRELIEEMEAEANVWVIDLRTNGGGVVDAVGAVGSLFCGPGVYIALRERDGTTYYYGADTPAITDKPVVVLINEYTASAAEALTAALRDYGRAVVIGEQSYGKGVAQDLFWDEQYPEYFLDGDGVKLTTSRFYSPLGNTNDTLGIIPDFNLPANGNGDAAELVEMLAPTWSGKELKDALTFSLEGTWYTVDLDKIEYDEVRLKRLHLLLETLPWYTTMVWGGGLMDVETVAGAFGLELERWVFPDGEEGELCGADIYDALYTYELMLGKDDGLFHPRDPLTRAEMCQLVAVALNCSVPQNRCPFADVAEDAWYAPAVTALYNRGMVTGDGKGLFHPEEAVSHQEFCAVMGRLYAWLNCDIRDIGDSAGEEELSLRALREYDSWAKAPVWLLSCGVENGYGGIVNLLWDEPEEIDPHQETTRDEAAAVLYQMLSYLTIL